MCHPHSPIPCGVGFVLDHFFLTAAAILSATVLGIAWVLRKRKFRGAEAASKAAPMPAHTRANKLLPWALALCAAIVIWVLWPDNASGAAPPIGPAPAPHPSCGEAPLIIHNEDTGELFPAVSVTYYGPAGQRVLSFRDARVFCNGYEVAAP